MQLRWLRGGPAPQHSISSSSNSSFVNVAAAAAAVAHPEPPQPVEQRAQQQMMVMETAIVPHGAAADDGHGGSGEQSTLQALILPDPPTRPLPPRTYLPEGPEIYKLPKSLDDMYCDDCTQNVVVTVCRMCGMYLCAVCEQGFCLVTTYRGVRLRHNRDYRRNEEQKMRAILEDEAPIPRSGPRIGFHGGWVYDSEQKEKGKQLAAAGRNANMAIKKSEKAYTAIPTPNGLPRALIPLGTTTIQTPASKKARSETTETSAAFSSKVRPLFQFVFDVVNSEIKAFRKKPDTCNTTNTIVEFAFDKPKQELADEHGKNAVVTHADDTLENYERTVERYALNGELGYQEELNGYDAKRIVENARMAGETENARMVGEIVETIVENALSRRIQN